MKKILCAPTSYVAEFIGVFFFVFIGAGSIMTAAYTGMTGGTALLQVAVAHGFAIAVMVAATGAVSGGHLNPAVTLAMVLKKEITFLKGLGYVGAQLAGGVLAASVLYGISQMIQSNGVATAGAVAATNLGTPALGVGIDQSMSVVIELVLTAALVFVILRTAVEQKLSWAPLAIGLTVFIGVLVGGPFTGAALNPARALGPAVFSGQWESHWIYWTGPMLGAVVGWALNGLLHKSLAVPKK